MKIVIIGAGPAGLMCAYMASQNDKNKIILLDKNEKIGKKLFITGKGRCNITNLCNKDEFLKNVVNNSKFLYSAISNFSPQDTVEFFNKNGLKTTLERGNRVFPASEKSSDVIKIFQRLLKNQNVELCLNSNVKNAYYDGTQYVVCLDNKKLLCDALVVATGGKSYPTTGSTGDGYKIAKGFSHLVVDPKPALCPILLKDYDGSLAGLSLKNVSVSIKIGNKKFTQFGEMLFTHNGLSGPIILTLSSFINKFDLQGTKLFIDLKPALDIKQLENRLLRDFETNKNKSIKNYLKELMPSSLIKLFAEKAHLQLDAPINQITKSQRNDLITTLKGMEFTIDSLEKIDYAIVTSGGVSVKDIDPKTMESKFNKNLYFIGEVLDVDALTGGFNIQVALATGHACGQHLSKLEGEK